MKPSQVVHPIQKPQAQRQRMRNFHGGKEEVNHPLDLFGAITIEAKRYGNQ